MKFYNLYEELISKLVVDINSIKKHRKINIQQTNVNIKECAEKQIEEMTLWTIRESLKKEK